MDTLRSGLYHIKSHDLSSDVVNDFDLSVVVQA